MTAPHSSQGGQRTWSWARTSAEVAERRAHAERLVGQVLSAVRYVDIDYAEMDHPDRPKGPRLIADPAEREQPMWRYPGFDSIDYGVELETEEGRVFSITWDPPREIEGIGIRELPLLDTLRPGAAVAIWDVSEEDNWRDVRGRHIVAVELKYLPWSGTSGGFWCPGVILRFGEYPVVFALADAGAADELAPSADNVAVIFDQDDLPSWQS